MTTTLLDEFDLDIQLGTIDFVATDAATGRTSGWTTGDHVCCTDYCCTVNC